MASSSGRGTPRRVDLPLPPGDTVVTGNFGLLAVADGEFVVHLVRIGASNRLEAAGSAGASRVVRPPLLRMRRCAG